MFQAVALAAQLACAHIKVQSGDTLSNIASKHGKTWHYVWQENTFIKNPDLIYPGEEITICDASLPIVSQSMENTTYPQVMHNQPCQSPLMFPKGDIFMWETPIGCYGGVYFEGKGDCYGWVRYLLGDNLYQVSGPGPGVAVHIPAYVEGASSQGHWAYILSIRGQWALVSEENMYWRGGGYGKVTFRYLLLVPSMLYYR